VSGIDDRGKTSVRSQIIFFTIIGGVTAFTFRGDKLKPYSFRLVNIGTTSINFEGQQLLLPATANNVTSLFFPRVGEDKRSDRITFAFSGAGIASAYIVADLEIKNDE